MAVPEAAFSATELALSASAEGASLTLSTVIVYVSAVLRLPSLTWTRTE